MSNSGTSLFGHICISLGYIDRAQLAECLQLQGEQLAGRRIGEILSLRGYVKAPQVQAVLARQRDLAMAERKRQADQARAAATRYQEGGAAEDGFFDINAPPAPPRKDDSYGRLDPLLVKLIAAGWERGASDVHVQSDSVPWLRLQGLLVRVGSEPLRSDRVSEMILTLLQPEDLIDFERDGDIDVAWESPAGWRLRANCFETTRGPGVVLRLVPAEIPTLEELNIPHVVARMAAFHQGLVMITGPAGSGKSSTVHALVRLINEERKLHVLCLEDPIEFVHPIGLSNVLQRQIPEHSASFQTALRAALREDPDVLVIGDMRDPETIMLAITAAETGHLVLGTLNTMDVAGTIDRLVGAFPTEQQSQVRSMLSDSLRGIVSQRLLRRRNGQGRVPATEILFNGASVARLIREGQTYQIPNVLQTGRRLGMGRFEDSIDDLRKQGHIDEAEAKRAATR